ncbi:MAG: hypothetical protein QOF53_2573, partial [Nocardioidaceae bacterium]|nr:hypothetical protein [Nocardioidaceae bacterium]
DAFLMIRYGRRDLEPVEPDEPSDAVPPRTPALTY